MGMVLLSSYDCEGHIEEPTSVPTPESASLQGPGNASARAIRGERQVHAGRLGRAGGSVHVSAQETLFPRDGPRGVRSLGYAVAPQRWWTGSW